MHVIWHLIINNLNISGERSSAFWCCVGSVYTQYWSAVLSVGWWGILAWIGTKWGRVWVVAFVASTWPLHQLDVIASVNDCIVEFNWFNVCLQWYRVKSSVGGCICGIDVVFAWQNLIHIIMYAWMWLLRGR